MQKILVISAGYPPGYRFGGPARTVHNLVQEGSAYADFWVIAPDRDLRASKPYEGIARGKWLRQQEVMVLYSPPFPFDAVNILRSLWGGRFDAVYVNSFFSVTRCLLPVICAAFLGVRIVIATRGQLSLSALSLKSGKKRLYLLFWRAMRLSKCIVWQATSHGELEDIRREFGRSQSVFVAENTSGRRFIEPSDRHDGGVLRLVFLSRIVQMKNLDYALRCLAKVKDPVRLDVYGPIEDTAYWSKCEKLRDELPGNIQMNYLGEVEGHLVPDVLARYDALFLPTRGENYGHVIVESFCVGLPVLISDRTPWRKLREMGIGWDFPLDNPHAFVEAITQLANTNPARNVERRFRVYHWAKSRFSGDQELKKALQILGVTIINSATGGG